MIFNFFNIKKKIPAPWKKYYNDVDMNIKIPNLTMYNQLKNISIKFPNNVAIEYFGNNIKYKTLLKRIDNCALCFKKYGVRKGNIVSICLPNVPEALIALYALNKIGAIANMILPLSAEQEIKESLLSTNSNYLIIIDMCYSKIKDIINSTKVK